MKKYTMVFSLTLFCLVTSTNVYSSIHDVNKPYRILINVVNDFNRPLSNILVYVEDGYSCMEGRTNNEGKVVFEVNSMPSIIYISGIRSNPSYGVKAYIPNMSASEFTIRLPLFPKDKRQALMQIDNMINIASSAYGYYSAADFIHKGMSNNLPSHGAGVPGIFSINPIPVVDQRGKLGLQLSGILVEPIIRIFMNAQKKLTGLDYDIYYGGI